MARPAPLRTPNARSLPQRRVFIAASLVGGVAYLLSIWTVIALGWLLLVRRETELLPAFLAAVASVPVIWLVGYGYRRAAKCPLCHGTPLLDTVSAKHGKALRIPPLNHGATAMVHLAGCGRFRCMYCGTPYQLFRKQRRTAH